MRTKSLLLLLASMLLTTDYAMADDYHLVMSVNGERTEKGEKVVLEDGDELCCMMVDDEGNPMPMPDAEKYYYGWHIATFNAYRRCAITKLNTGGETSTTLTKTIDPSWLRGWLGSGGIPHIIGEDRECYHIFVMQFRIWKKTDKRQREATVYESECESFLHVTPPAPYGEAAILGNTWDEVYDMDAGECVVKIQFPPCTEFGVNYWCEVFGISYYNSTDSFDSWHELSDTYLLPVPYENGYLRAYAINEYGTTITKLFPKINTAVEAVDGISPSVTIDGNLLNISSETGIDDAQIYSAEGRLIYKKRKFKRDAIALPRGIFIVKITSNHQSITRKIIIK